MQHLHSALAGTRGAAAACALLDADKSKVDYAGVGNISGSVVTAERSRGMVSHNGTLGVQLLRNAAVRIRLARRRLRRHAFGRNVRSLDLDRPIPAFSTRHPAVIAGVLYRDHARRARRCHGRRVVAFDHEQTRLTSLRGQIAAQQAELAVLEAELTETNKGVVALYAELDDNAVQLREAADLKSRFLSYMSHEFRTPLASITSIADILVAGMDGPLTTEQQRQLQFVQGSVRELTEMVDDLLDLAKVEAGRISISPEWFEMVDLFSALRGMFKPIVGSGAVVPDIRGTRLRSADLHR